MAPPLKIRDQIHWVAELGLARKIVDKTEGASAAFIKELLRRSAQFLLERDPQSQKLEQTDCDAAIEEMLHSSSFRALKIENPDAK